VSEGGQSIFSICLGQQYLPQAEILSLVYFPWDSFGHTISELLSSTIKVSHGDLGCSWRSCSSVEINGPFPHYLGFKGFYPGGNESGLEGMT
jgi:hypothetical protein